jgi:hypothetical protein
VSSILVVLRVRVRLLVLVQPGPPGRAQGRRDSDRQRAGERLLLLVLPSTTTSSMSTTLNLKNRVQVRSSSLSLRLQWQLGDSRMMIWPTGASVSAASASVNLNSLVFCSTASIINPATRYPRSLQRCLDSTTGVEAQVQLPLCRHCVAGHYDCESGPQKVDACRTLESQQERQMLREVKLGAGWTRHWSLL